MTLYCDLQIKCNIRIMKKKDKETPQPAILPPDSAQWSGMSAPDDWSDNDSSLSIAITNGHLCVGHVVKRLSDLAPSTSIRCLKQLMPDKITKRCKPVVRTKLNNLMTKMFWSVKIHRALYVHYGQRSLENHTHLQSSVIRFLEV